jgi:hypothetical protein
MKSSSLAEVAGTPILLEALEEGEARRLDRRVAAAPDPAAALSGEPILALEHHDIARRASRW